MAPTRLSAQEASARFQRAGSASAHCSIRRASPASRASIVIYFNHISALPLLLSARLSGLRAAQPERPRKRARAMLQCCSLIPRGDESFSVKHNQMYSKSRAVKHFDPQAPTNQICTPFSFTPSRQLSPTASPSVGHPSPFQRTLSRTLRLCGSLARPASIKCAPTASPKTENGLLTLPAYFPTTMGLRGWYAPWPQRI